MKYKCLKKDILIFFFLEMTISTFIFLFAIIKNIAYNILSRF
jgi:hypothetical protein